MAVHSLKAAALVNLPVETLHEIFSLIVDLYDLLFLTATCQVLWEIGREHMCRHIVALAASYSWTGDRIVCIGHYLSNEDIPETLFTPAEREEFILPERLLWDYPFDEVAERNLNLSQLWSNKEIYDRLGGFRLGHLSPELRVVHRLCDYAFAWRQPEPVVRVLRNLSRLQYVRESVLLDLTSRYPKVGFGEVILSRICLSSIDSTNMACPRMYRGVWAGDRFDIVDAKWLEELGEDASWNDVSEEVLDEMEAICEDNYQFNW